MSTALAVALGKPPASKELKRALDADVYNELLLPPSGAPVQTVAQFLADKQASHLGSEFLMQPVCVTTIGAPDVSPSWVPFLNAYLDVSTFHAASIPAFAAQRTRMLLCPLPGQAGSMALNVQQVVDAASRHCPPRSTTVVILTSHALRHVDEHCQSATSTTVANGKLILVVSMGTPSAMWSPHAVVRALLQALGMRHCHFFECAMTASSCPGTPSETTPTFVLCPLCLRKCSLVLPQFNIVRRYEVLLSLMEGGVLDGIWVDSFQRWCEGHVVYITNTPRPPRPSKQVAGGSVDASKLRLLKLRLAARRRR